MGEAKRDGLKLELQRALPKERSEKVMRVIQAKREGCWRMSGVPMERM